MNKTQHEAKPKTPWVRRIVFAAVVLALSGAIGWVAYINIQVHKPFDETQFAPATEPEPEVEAKREYHCQVVYSPGYLINLGGLEKLHPFDIRKYEKIHNQLLEDGVLTDEQTHKPASISNEDFLLVHSDKYLQSLNSRANIARYLEANTLVFAPVSLDKAVLEPFRRASGGTVLASRLALEHGLAVNIGGGYHHAKPHTGEGFCVYADVPIAIRKLQAEKLIQTAVVVDVDVHQGNGTAVCLAGDDTTFTFSMHQGDIYPIPKENSDHDVELPAGMGDAAYNDLLQRELAKVLDKANADICFIVGGCDTLAGDPLASLEMTHEGIVQRDQIIVDACVERNIPVVLTLSGGYSEGAWRSQYLSIKNLIEKFPPQQR